MSNVKHLKEQIKDLVEYKYTLEPFSRASLNTHNAILKLKQQLPKPMSIESLDLLVTSFIVTGLDPISVLEILETLEDTDDRFYFKESDLTYIFNNLINPENENAM